MNRCTTRACPYPSPCPDHDLARHNPWHLNGGMPHHLTAAAAATAADIETDDDAERQIRKLMQPERTGGRRR